MKLLLQILFFYFTWFTNLVNATPVFAKNVFPIYEVTFSITKNLKDEGVIKIGEQNFARSGISEKSHPLNANLRENYVLEESRASMSGELVQGAGRTLTQMRNSVDEWIALQRQLATSNNQLREFNTATILYNKATGKYYYGANRGITVSGAEIHPTLTSHLPETSTNAYKIGNCAECDAVNQALHDGANWDDLQMHTVGVQWNTGGTFPKPLCSNCEVTFTGIEILQ